jgi:nucleoside-diphosphate-sugar epimerase
LKSASGGTESLKIAIVGCGYVGQAIARYWRQYGHLVTVTTTTPQRVEELQSLADRVLVVKGNDPTAIGTALEGQELVLLSLGARQRDAYRETYLETARTLSPLLSGETSVKQVIYTGSYAVYGDRQGQWVDENTPVAPANENGEILAETERVLLAGDRQDLAVCILRLGGIYGPGREIAKIFRPLAGTTRPGTGREVSNWIHLDDIVAALEFARAHRLRGVYNLVNDTPLEQKELLDRLCELHNLEPISWDPTATERRPYNARVSNRKLIEAGFRCRYPQTRLDLIP